MKRDANVDYAASLGWDDEDRKVAQSIYDQLEKVEEELEAALDRGDQKAIDQLRAESDRLAAGLP